MKTGSLKPDSYVLVFRYTLGSLVSPLAIVNPRMLEHGFRMISAGIPYTLREGQKENEVPTFWLLLYTKLEAQIHTSLM